MQSVSSFHPSSVESEENEAQKDLQGKKIFKVMIYVLCDSKRTIEFQIPDVVLLALHSDQRLGNMFHGTAGFVQLDQCQQRISSVILLFKEGFL